MWLISSEELVKDICHSKMSAVIGQGCLLREKALKASPNCGFPWCICLSKETGMMRDVESGMQWYIGRALKTV